MISWTSFGVDRTPGDAEPSGPTRRLQRLWLALLFVVGVGYAFLVPPFQTIDEAWHWQRLWAVVQGDYNCKQMPNSAEQFVQQHYRFDYGPKRGPVEWSIFGDMYHYKGPEGSFPIATAACKYPPTGYLPAALTTRLITPGKPLDRHWHKMFYALYGSRLGNWLFFFACVVAALRLGRYPVPVMIFASIPMVAQQATAINNDAVQFGGVLLACALLTRRPARVALWSAIVLIALMSSIKPINAIAGTLVWISLWVAVTQHGMRRSEAIFTAASALLVPVATWVLWNETMYLEPTGAVSGVPVANVSRDAQLALLRAEPMKFLYVLGWQVQQLFTATPINGGWRGILLALGWYKLPAPDYVYPAVLGAIGTGLLLLRHDARGELSQRRVPRILIAAAAVSIVPYFAVVTLLLYLEFTSVGTPMVYGVQGRYYLYFIAMLLFLVPMARSHLPHASTRSKGRLMYAFVALSIVGNLVALWAIRQHFWEA